MRPSTVRPREVLSTVTTAPANPPQATDRGWFIVAGPELTPSQFHCAIVGARAAVDANDLINAAHWRAAQAGERGRIDLAGDHLDEALRRYCVKHARSVSLRPEHAELSHGIDQRGPWVRFAGEGGISAPSGGEKVGNWKKC